MKNKRHLVIYSANESASNDGLGFWNNQTGWGRLYQANHFTVEQAETKPLPKSTGNDAKFVDFEEISRHYE